MKIGILPNKYLSLSNIPLYIMLEITKAWRAEGHEIKLLKGIAEKPDIGLLFIRVDATYVPDKYIGFYGNYPRVINGKVHDMSRRSLNSYLLSQHDKYEGPVMVKTNLNCGGLPLRDTRGFDVDFQYPDTPGVPVSG